MNNILLIDDHQVIHDGLINILQHNFLVKNIVSAHNLTEIENGLKKHEYELVILDISMPNLNVFDTINLIKKANGNTKIIIFSMMSGRTYALRLIKAGADGYIEKKQPKIEIINAIKKVVSGKKYMSEDVLYNNIDYVNTGKNPLSILSNQELIVLKCLINGDTNNSVAHKLNLNPSTISTVKRRIFDKLHCTSVIELADIFNAHN